MVENEREKGIRSFIVLQFREGKDVVPPTAIIDTTGTRLGHRKHWEFYYKFTLRPFGHIKKTVD